MESLILSLDIGTSSSKVVLFDVLGRQLSSGSGGYSIRYPGPDGHVEQRPDEIWQGICEAVGKLGLAPDQLGRLRAIALGSQISSYFFVDAEGSPLTDIITWMDRRASKEAEELKETFDAATLHRMVGAVLPVGPSWPIPKIKWIGRHRPDVLQRARYIVQPKDWVLWKMTGQWKSDVSSMRWLVHQESREACGALLQWAGAGAELLLPAGDPFETAGELNAYAAEALGLPARLPVVLGWNDINAAVLGLMGGNRRVGFDMSGTSEHIGIIAPIARSPGEAAGAGVSRIPFLNGMEMIYGVTSSGGFAFQWFMDQVEATAGTEQDYEAVIKAASLVPFGSGGLLFLPYLQGERSPWWNPHARGVFFGLSPQHGRAHMSRAVLEGVGFALKSITERVGYRPSVYRIAGGASRIPLWNEIKANILGTPLETLETAETGCLGAAILAAYGTGLYGSLEEASANMTRIKETIDPVPSQLRTYEAHYALFVELYEALVPLFAKSGRLQEGGMRA